MKKLFVIDIIFIDIICNLGFYVWWFIYNVFVGVYRIVLV